VITRLPASQRVAVPWKNGGGVTREIAVYPEGASMDDFLWRVSMAEVSEAGAFSRFDRIDRHLTVLEGQLRLELPDRQYTLFPRESLAFEGDTPVMGTPLTTHVLDLNIMTRHGHFSAEVTQITGPAEIRADLIIALDAARVSGFDFLPYDALQANDEKVFMLADGSVMAISLHRDR